MATITTDTYLDGGIARTAGEAMTITTGGKLTVRTDTRFHANAPASMTGSLGSLSVTEGEFLIDATQVRWLAITGGSGTSAIGTTVTQGAVSGYFLGYYASLTSAPSTTIGATGFIKLREVTGGTFSAGALSGITATASGADVTGWLEVVLNHFDGWVALTCTGSIVHIAEVVSGDILVRFGSGSTANGFTMKPGDTLKAEETVYVKAVVSSDSYPIIHVIKD